MTKILTKRERRDKRILELAQKKRELEALLREEKRAAAREEKEALNALHTTIGANLCAIFEAEDIDSAQELSTVLSADDVREQLQQLLDGTHPDFSVDADSEQESEDSDAGDGYGEQNNEPEAQHENPFASSSY